ncbi:MAG: hypothetical protein ACRDFX_12680 [Chloroflexota bacterium]
MRTAAKMLSIVVGVAGTIQIVLGILFWSGRADTVIPVHVVVGLILVVSLWILAVLAYKAGVNPNAVALAAVWGVIVPVVGLAQTRILPGGAHWVIQAVHLLLGLAAIALAQMLAGRIRHLLPPEPVHAMSS